jgi:hypothetical protein
MENTVKKISKNVVLVGDVKYAIPNTGNQITLKESVKIGASKYFKVVS